jgi:hypothetical protein
MSDTQQSFETTDATSPGTSERPDVTMRKKNKLIAALTNYLEARGITDVANSADAATPSASGSQLQEQQPQKMLWLFNATHQHTSDKKVALVKAAINSIRSAESSDVLTLLGLAIIDLDMTIEFEKSSEKQVESFASISGQKPEDTIPNYSQILADYVSEDKTLTLDLAKHPNPKRSRLLKSVLPLLDGDEGLAPDAKKCADVIATFRQLFKITYVDQKLKSKYTHANSIADKYRNDLVIATYQALIEVKNQTLSKFREILLNVLVIERRLSTNTKHYILNQEPIIDFNLDKYQSIPGVIIDVDSADSKAIEEQTTKGNIGRLQFILGESYGLAHIAMTDIKKPTVKNLFKQDVVRMTDLETFVRKAVDDLAQVIQDREQKFKQRHLY